MATGQKSGRVSSGGAEFGGSGDFGHGSLAKERSNVRKHHPQLSMWAMRLSVALPSGGIDERATPLEIEFGELPEVALEASGVVAAGALATLE